MYIVVNNFKRPKCPAVEEPGIIDVGHLLIMVDFENMMGVIGWCWGWMDGVGIKMNYFLCSYCGNCTKIITYLEKLAMKFVF